MIDDDPRAAFVRAWTIANLRISADALDGLCKRLGRQGMSMEEWNACRSAAGQARLGADKREAQHD